MAAHELIEHESIITPYTDKTHSNEREWVFYSIIIENFQSLVQFLFQ